MRKGPSYDAPAIYDRRGRRAVIEVGEHFGRQSNRDGGQSRGCPDPGSRASVNGFIWGYPEAYDPRLPRGFDPRRRVQGWIPYEAPDGGDNMTISDDDWRGRTCGPAERDFDCRFDRGDARGACREYQGCRAGSSFAEWVRGKAWRSDRGEREIAFRHPDPEHPRHSGRQLYYLRWAYDSTAYLWLVPGDRVQRLGRTTKDDFRGRRWTCVEVTAAQWAPPGSAGWIRSEALTTLSDRPEPELQVPAAAFG